MKLSRMSPMLALVSLLAHPALAASPADQLVVKPVQQRVAAKQEKQELLGMVEAWQSALVNNQGLQSKEFLLRAEREGVREAWSALLPQIDAMASYGWSEHKRDYGRQMGKRTETDNPSRYDVGLNQVIYSREASRGITRARAAESLTEAELDAFRLHIGYLAIESYLDASRVRAEAKVVAGEVTNEERRLEQLESMRKHGFASKADTLEAQARLDETRAEQIALDSEYRAALMHLQAVTGIEMAGRDLRAVPVDAWRSTLLLLERDWVATALESSGELSRARSELKLAKESVKYAQSSHWPTLHLSARYNKNDTFSTNVLEETRVEMQLRVPLYKGGGTSARVRQAREKMHAGQYQVQDTENNVRVEVSRLSEELRGSYGRIRALQAADESAKAALDVAEQGFVGGVRSLNELLDSRTRLSRVQRSLVGEIHRNLAMQFRLRQLSGKLSQADVEQAFLRTR